jgi:ketosteroid isomerase-like protein
MDNRTIARTLLARLTAGDYEGALEFVSSDFHCIEAENMPYAGDYRGKQGFIELMGKLFSVFNDFEIVDMTADGDAVILQVTMINRSDKGVFRMPLTELWQMPGGQLTKAIPCYFDPGIVQDFMAGNIREVAKDAFHRPMAEDAGGSRARNVEVVQALLAKAASGEWDGAEPYLHPDFAVIEAPSTPYGGEYRGFGGFPAILQKLKEAWGEDGTFSIDEVIADDRRVFMIETLRGKLGGTYIEMFLNEMWELEDGKVRRVVPYYLDAKKMGDLHAQKAKRVTTAA